MVVPLGQAPRLIDGPVREERFAAAFVVAAIAQASPSPGRVFVVPSAALYGTDPLGSGIDSIRVVRLDTLVRGDESLRVVVLERTDGGQLWADLATGSLVAARGNAGPRTWWWHVRRGVAASQLQP